MTAEHSKYFVSFSTRDYGKAQFSLFHAVGANSKQLVRIRVEVGALVAAMSLQNRSAPSVLL